MRLTISAKKALFYLMLFTLIVESIVKYSGVTWGATIYANVMIMQGKTIPMVKYIVLLLIVIQLIWFSQIPPNYISLCGIGLVVCGIFWCVINMETGAQLIYMDSPPALLIEIGGLFIILQDDFRQRSVKRLCGIFAVLYTGMTVVALIQFLNQYLLVRMANGNVIEYFANALFLLIGWNCIINRNGKQLYVLYACCISLVLVSIFITSRGWMLQAIILTATVYLSNSSRSVQSKIKRVILTIGAFLFIYYIASNYLENELAYIVNRIGQDTRSGQLNTFFREVPIYKLITGQGMNATYLLDGRQYAYVDNIYLFWMLRYGIIPVICYWSLFVGSIISKTRTLSNNAGLQYNMLSIMWILAMGGVCIYYTIRIDMGNIFLISFAISNILSKRGQMILDTQE